MPISVVIPAYNEEKYIAKTLESLARQTYRDFEVVLSITGDDATAEVARQFFTKHDIAHRLVFPERKGVALARQQGTQATRYPIIASTDADAIVPPDWLARIQRFFDQNARFQAVYGPVYFFDGSPLQRATARCLYPLFLHISRFFGNDNVAGNNMAFRAAASTRVGGYSTKVDSCEDIELIQRVKTVGPIAYRRDIFAQVSARRMQNGLLLFLMHNLRNYLRIFILRKSPRPFEDIR